MFSREKAADPLVLAKYLQGLSAVGHQHGVLPGLHILSGISSSIFSSLIFRRSAKLVWRPSGAHGTA